MTATDHRSGALVLNDGHRAHCSCCWLSDCYAQLSDSDRAVEVHLRKSEPVDVDTLIAKSSIRAAIARSMTPRVRRKV
jgi:hypothetical protein